VELTGLGGLKPTGGRHRLCLPARCALLVHRELLLLGLTELPCRLLAVLLLPLLLISVVAHRLELGHDASPGARPG